MFQPGDQIIPGYTLQSKLGRGTFGEVWRALGPGATPVALKVIDLAGKAGHKELRGIRRVKDIRHPHLMSFNGIWMLDQQGNVMDDSTVESFGGEVSLTGTMYGRPLNQPKPDVLVAAMQLGDKNLHDRFVECQAEGLYGIPIEELLGHMEDAAKGIDFLNSPEHNFGEGLVAVQHCDIKPENLMLVGKSVSICDFGLAKVLSDNHATATEMQGTPAYIAPEMIEEKPSRWTDQYSLACTFYHLRTGVFPFGNLSSALAVIKAHAAGELDLSKISHYEREVVRRATSLNPEKRFDSTTQFVAELRKAVARDASSSTDGRRRPKRTLVIAACLGAFVLAGTVAVIKGNDIRMWFAGREDPKQITTAGEPAHKQESPPDDTQLTEPATIDLTDVHTSIKAHDTQTVEAFYQELDQSNPETPAARQIIRESILVEANQLLLTYDTSQKRADLDLALVQFEMVEQLSGETALPSRQHARLGIVRCKCRQGELAAAQKTLGEIAGALDQTQQAVAVTLRLLSEPIPVHDRIRRPDLARDFTQLARAAKQLPQDGGAFAWERDQAVELQWHIAAETVISGSMPAENGEVLELIASCCPLIVSFHQITTRLDQIADVQQATNDSIQKLRTEIGALQDPLKSSEAPAEVTTKLARLVAYLEWSVAILDPNSSADVLKNGLERWTAAPIYHKSQRVLTWLSQRFESELLNGELPVNVVEAARDWFESVRPELVTSFDRQLDQRLQVIRLLSVAMSPDPTPLTLNDFSSVMPADQLAGPLRMLLLASELETGFRLRDSLAVAQWNRVAANLDQLNSTPAKGVADCYRKYVETLVSSNLNQGSSDLVDAFVQVMKAYVDARNEPVAENAATLLPPFLQGAARRKNAHHFIEQAVSRFRNDKAPDLQTVPLTATSAKRAITLLEFSHRRLVVPTQRSMEHLALAYYYGADDGPRTIEAAASAGAVEDLDPEVNLACALSYLARNEAADSARAVEAFGRAIRDGMEHTDQAGYSKINERALRPALAAVDLIRAKWKGPIDRQSRIEIDDDLAASTRAAVAEIEATRARFLEHDAAFEGQVSNAIERRYLSFRLADALASKAEYAIGMAVALADEAEGLPSPPFEELLAITNKVLDADAQSGDALVLNGQALILRARQAKAIEDREKDYIESNQRFQVGIQALSVTVSPTRKARYLNLASTSHVERAYLAKSSLEEKLRILTFAEKYARDGLKELDRYSFFKDHPIRQAAFICLGNALEDVAYYAKQDVRKNFDDAIDAFVTAYKLGSNEHKALAQMNAGRCRFRYLQTMSVFAREQEIEPSEFAKLAPPLIAAAQQELKTALEAFSIPAQKAEAYFWQARLSMQVALDLKDPKLAAQSKRMVAQSKKDIEEAIRLSEGAKWEHWMGYHELLAHIQHAEADVARLNDTRQHVLRVINGQDPDELGIHAQQLVNVASIWLRAMKAEEVQPFWDEISQTLKARFEEHELAHVFWLCAYADLVGERIRKAEVPDCAAKARQAEEEMKSLVKVDPATQWRVAKALAATANATAFKTESQANWTQVWEKRSYQLSFALEHGPIVGCSFKDVSDVAIYLIEVVQKTEDPGARNSRLSKFEQLYTELKAKYPRAMNVAYRNHFNGILAKLKAR